MTTEHDHLFHYLRNSKIKIDKKEFTFQVKSHPDYPSLLAISDTLSFFKIKNYLFKVPKEIYADLPKEYLAVGGTLRLHYSYKINKKSFIGNWQKVLEFN